MILVIFTNFKRCFSLIGLPGADGENEEDNDVTMVSLEALLEIGMSIIMTSLCLLLTPHFQRAKSLVA